jgi:hypothetical protein|tara:strand:- start:993 stop:1484 length:492 start_codon:yes stop_codon:yes gene_type:complete
MKTFKQFSEQAYSQAHLVENPILSYASGVAKDIKNIPGNIRQGVSSLRKDPVGTIRRGARGLGSMMVKGEIGNQITRPIKNLTGNNPAINFALDTATDVASYTPGWRSAAKRVLPAVAKPLALASAGILATPTAVADGTLTGAQRRELDQRRRKNPNKMGPAY